MAPWPWRPWPPAVYCSSSAILAIVLLYAGILLFVLFMATLNDIKKLLEEEIRPIRSKLLSIEVVEAKLIQFDLLPSH